MECERCGDECKRRKLCPHCGFLVCPWCWHHICGCLPNHRPERCVHLNAMKRKGREWFLTKVTALQRRAANLPPLRKNQ